MLKRVILQARYTYEASLKLILLFICIVTLLGCTDHTYKYFDFDSKVAQTEYGISGAVLSGKFVKISKNPQITTFGNPYDFMITFTTDIKSHSPILVKNIQIHSNKPNMPVLYKFTEGNFNTKWSNYQKKWFSSWRVEDIKVKHIPLIIQFDLIFNINGKIQIIPIKKYYSPKYREEESNDFWDGIMSV